MKHSTWMLRAAVLVAIAAPAFADTIVLSTGEKLEGTVVERTANQVVFDHPVLGRLTIPVEKISAEPAPPPPPPPPPAPPSPWKFRAEFGASGTRGDVDQSELHAAVGAIMEDSERRFKADAVLAKAKVEDTETKDAKYIEATHDWKLSNPRWSIFATVRMDWDDFQDWDKRLLVGAGVGYLAVDQEDLKVRLRAGLAATREWGSSDPDDEDWRPEGILGAEADWKVNETNTIEARLTLYPDLSDGGEYRAIASISWAVKLAKDSGLSLKFGVEDEYDSHREDPFENNNMKYFAALLWEF